MSDELQTSALARSIALLEKHVDHVRLARPQETAVADAIEVVLLALDRYMQMSMGLKSPPLGLSPQDDEV